MKRATASRKTDSTKYGYSGVDPQTVGYKDDMAVRPEEDPGFQ
jgi:hypothetical protein